MQRQFSAAAGNYNILEPAAGPFHIDIHSYYIIIIINCTNNLLKPLLRYTRSYL